MTEPRVLAVAVLATLLIPVTACGGDDGSGSSGSSDSSRLSGEQRAELLGPEDPATGEPVRIGMISDGATQAYDASDELGCRCG